MSHSTKHQIGIIKVYRTSSSVSVAYSSVRSLRETLEYQAHTSGSSLNSSQEQVLLRVYVTRLVK